MTRQRDDRRRRTHELRTRAPSSPANLLIMAVVGVLGITAAAAAFMGSGYDDVTPHGQLLGDLQAVADAQVRHYEDRGQFAQWTRTLAVETSPDVRLAMVRAGADEWEAVAHHPIGLSCTQGGRVVDGVVTTDPPTCFTGP